VRLLTIHGAKGLEAPLVLLLDTDGESVKAQTMGVLVVWPGEHAYPQRFVFLASESKPSACVADALALEQAARQREELNALYVALTRTQHTLVVSSLEPHAGRAGSWWQRLQPLATDAPGVGAAVPLGAAHVGAAALQEAYTLKVLPKLSVNVLQRAQSIAGKRAIVVGVPVDADAAPAQPDSVESRIGQAMHRLLECVALRPANSAPFAWPPDQLERAARDFLLEADHLLVACQMAQCILKGQGGWAWHSEHIGWHANEVTLAQKGRILRLDRLVQHRTTGHWWVLDYKSSAAPQHQAELCAQLSNYRTAVVGAYPGHTVRAAFLTAQGALIELELSENIP
jgi:ATP-dependent helicase/nuclease subunit A